MSDVILSVRELTEELRRSLEGRFPFVWVRGEVTNLTRPGSGHVYFSLKDQDAQLQCVWFRQRQGRGGQAFDPLTGEVFDAPRPAPVDLLRNGLDVLCAGRISVYAPRGQYQLAVELAQPAGEGLLAQAFEERKRKLAALGYFAAERKRGLPWDPQRVALITSPTARRCTISGSWRPTGAVGRGYACSRPWCRGRRPRLLWCARWKKPMRRAGRRSLCLSAAAVRWKICGPSMKRAWRRPYSTPGCRCWRALGTRWT